MKVTCPFCPKSFPSSVAFNVHLRTHTQKPEETPNNHPPTPPTHHPHHPPHGATCKICYLTFQGPAQLKNHMVNRHPQKRDPIDELLAISNHKQQCSQCARVFFSGFAFRVHMRVHGKVISQPVPKIASKQKSPGAALDAKTSGKPLATLNKISSTQLHKSTSNVLTKFPLKNPVKFPLFLSFFISVFSFLSSGSDSRVEDTKAFSYCSCSD
jgi:hypothetical protein